MNLVESKADTPSFEQLVSDPDAFESFVYTDIHDAFEELQRRQEDAALDSYLEKLMPHGPPEIMKERLCTVLFRHVATPNYEAQRFEILSSFFPELYPVIFEYSKDLFTNRNGWKFAMAKMCFDNGLSRTNERIREYKVILDINGSNVKPIETLKTHWGESLVDFHHRLFDASLKNLAGNYIDLSAWLKSIGPNAKDYYKAFLALFLKHGIQFEYFLLHGEEEPFTKEIIIPSLREIYSETGYKPIIVRLHPRESEGQQFWLSYPDFFKRFLEQEVPRVHNV